MKNNKEKLKQGWYIITMNNGDQYEAFYHEKNEEFYDRDVTKKQPIASCYRFSHDQLKITYWKRIDKPSNLNRRTFTSLEEYRQSLIRSSEYWGMVFEFQDGLSKRDKLLRQVIGITNINASLIERLYKKGIITLSDLVSYTESELSEKTGIRGKSLISIHIELDKLHLRLNQINKKYINCLKLLHKSIKEFDM